MSASSADGALVVVARHRHYKRISPSGPARRCRHPQHPILRREYFERRVVDVFDEGQPAAGVPSVHDIARRIGRLEQRARRPRHFRRAGIGSAASNVRSTVAVFLAMVLAERRSMPEIDAQVVHDPNAIATSCP